MIEKNKRPVVIDCANVACTFTHYMDNLGDGRGPVEAYKYWKGEGHKVKVFVMARKLLNKSNSKRVMANIELFEEEIPLQDRIRIPPDADDDSYFISWAMDKDAILVTNDLLRNHRTRLKGQELEKFNSWYIDGRCGFIFVDDEFIIDPNFRSTEAVVATKGEKAVALDTDLESTTTPFKPKNKPPEIPDEVIEDMRALSLSDKVLRETELDGELVVLKMERDESNRRTNRLRAERNAINQEVREKIAEVKALKASRDKHNLSAQELKKKRKIIDIELKATRKKDGSKGKQALSEQSRELKRKQDRAHEAVKEEVAKANEFHKLMMEKSEIIEKMRGDGTERHQQMEASKVKADSLHMEYILVLNTKFRLMELIMGEKKAIISEETQEIGNPKRPFISDILGDKEHEDISKEFGDLLKEVLVEYSPKSKPKAHIVDRAGLIFKLDEYTLQIISKEGWFLGILYENRRSIADAFVQKYDLGSFKMNLKIMKK